MIQSNSIYLDIVGREVPVFTIVEPSVEEWNRKARVQNTKLFVEIHERQPENYDEVLCWVCSIGAEQKENQPTANELAI
jgi:hypothetical protein